MNQFLTPYFVTHNMKKGSFLMSSPIPANWMAPAHNRWLVPLGWGIGKIKQPIVWQVNLYYNLIRPQNVPPSARRLPVALKYPKET